MENGDRKSRLYYVYGVYAVSCYIRMQMPESIAKVIPRAFNLSVHIILF